MKSKNQILNFIAALALLAALTVTAQQKGVGGIPGEVLTTDIVSDFSEPTASYMNPALSAEVDQTEITTGLRQVLSFWNPKYLNISVPLYERITVGLNAFWVGLPNIPETRLVNGELENTGNFLDFTDRIFGLNFAYKVLPFLSVGSNLNIVPQSFSGGSLDVTDRTKTGFGIDLGLIWNPINDYQIGDLKFGLTGQNLYYSPGLDKYPLNITWGASYSKRTYRSGMDRIELSVNGAVLDVMSDVENFKKVVTIPPDTADANPGQIGVRLEDAAKAVTPKFGAHAKYFPIRWLGIKGGLNTGKQITVGPELFWPAHIAFFSYFRVDYDYVIHSLSDDVSGVEELSHTIRVAARLGPTREQSNSERKYKKLLGEAQNLFEKAMRLYMARKYWEASFVFGELLVKWPNFHKVDVASFYMGKSYEYLYMYDIARKTYSGALKKYTTSDFAPKYIYQLENLDYKEGKYENAVQNYMFITNLYPETDVKPDADYIVGQVYYEMGKYEDAKRVLSSVPVSDENYLYAQYTLGMIAARQKELEKAKEYLSILLTVDSTKSQSEKTLVEGAATKLGHIYFEEMSLSKAMSAYKKVLPDSRFYPEAMLGMAWTFIKTGRPEAYTEADKIASEIISGYSEELLVAEAYLLKGYANTLLTNYEEAVSNYRACLRATQKELISESDVARRKNGYQVVQKRMDEVQKRVYTIAQKKPTPSLIERKQSLRPKFDQLNEAVREFKDFMKKAQSHIKFSRSLDKIKSDAEYALATTTHMISKGKTEKIKKKYDEMEDELKREEQELMEQLRQLEGN